MALFVAGWAVVVGGYAALYDVQHGHLGFSDYGGRFLYGQVAPFADCSKLPDLPAGRAPAVPRPAPPPDAQLLHVEPAARPSARPAG